MTRILALCSGDPESPRSYSGSLRQLLAALRAHGVLDDAIDVTEGEPSHRFSGWMKTLVRRRRLGSVLVEHWSARSIEARSARAAKLLAAKGGMDGVLQYGTDFFPVEPAAPGPGVPIGAAMDATFAQLVRSGEGPFGFLEPIEAVECIERQGEILARCDLLFPRTEWCARSLLDDYGLSRERVVVTGAGANFDDPLPERSGYDGRTILFVGRDWVRKNGPLLLDAFRLARRERPELRLCVVGPPGRPLREENVDWIGPLDLDRREALIELYSRASLFVCPSRFEPFGVAIVEAMAAGCPTVTLDRCAASEIVVDGVTGTCLHDAEPRALARVLLEWLGDRERLARAGEVARRRATEELTWRRAAERIAAAFDELG